MKSEYYNLINLKDIILKDDDQLKQTFSNLTPNVDCVSMSWFLHEFPLVSHSPSNYIV